MLRTFQMALVPLMECKFHNLKGLLEYVIKARNKCFTAKYLLKGLGLSIYVPYHKLRKGFPNFIADTKNLFLNYMSVYKSFA